MSTTSGGELLDGAGQHPSLCESISACVPSTHSEYPQIQMEHYIFYLLHSWQQAANFSRTDYAPPNSKGSYRARLYLRKAQRIGQTFRNVFNIINRRKQVRQTIETQQSIQTKCSTITQLRKLSKSRIDKAATTISIHPYKIAKTKLDIKL